MYWIKHYVTCGRSVVFTGYSTNKTGRPAITEILLKVALETITITLNQAAKTTISFCGTNLCVKNSEGLVN
jgi:hypothetical protein